jgi:hypothetical protein
MWYLLHVRCGIHFASIDEKKKVIWMDLKIVRDIKKHR